MDSIALLLTEHLQKLLTLRGRLIVEAKCDNVTSIFAHGGSR